MPRLRNLVPNPSCANNATGWSSSPAGYARSTSVDAGMPRTTGFEGTTAGYVNSPQFLVDAGTKIVISVSIKALAAQAFSFAPYFLDSTSGGTVVGLVGAQDVVLTAGQLERYVIGPVTVPTGALSCIVQLFGIDAGGVEISGLRACVATVHINADGVDIGDLADDGTYYDGGSPSWVWEGTAGSSTSARTFFADTATTVETFSPIKSLDANGRLAVDTAHGVDAFSIAASGGFADHAVGVDGFLIAQLTFDEANARIRLNAFTFSASVTHALIMRRTQSGSYALIRGGNVPIYSGRFARTVDDYEYEPGEIIYYRIQGVSDDGRVLQEATIRRDGFGVDQPWLKVVARPQYDLRIRMVGWGDFKFNARSSSFQVQGRQDKVYTNDVHDLKTTTVELLTITPAETKQLELSLTRGQPVYFQIPGVQDFPSMYASVGDFDAKNPKKKNSGHKVFTVNVDEIYAPAYSIFASLTTWQTVANGYTNWQSVIDAYGSWEDLAAS